MFLKFFCWKAQYIIRSYFEKVLIRNEALYRKENLHYKINEQCQNVNIKHFMISSTDTVINPLAMVVKFADAFVTDIAVATVESISSFTIWAKCVWIHFLDKFFKL